MDSRIYIQNLETAIIKSGHGEIFLNACINYASRLLDNGLPVIFDNIHLNSLLGTQNTFLNRIIFAPGYFYLLKEIKKKSGGLRELNIPALELKVIQRWILDNILEKMKVSSYATGFCKNKSIICNAKLHTGKQCVLNIDIENFFSSTPFEKVFRLFVYYGYTKEVAFLLSRICTYENVLPQGAPTSPYLSNIVNLKLDKRLALLATKYNANYSRYADDLTFSSNSDLKTLIPVVYKILIDEGYQHNRKKTRIQYKGQRQEVTGLIVNDNNVRVNKSYKRKLYQELYYCYKFGVQSHLEKINCNKAFYKEHLYGKAFFVNMVEPKEGEKLFNILERIKWDY